MENNKIYGSVKRLSLVSVILGIVALFGFVFGLLLSIAFNDGNVDPVSFLIIVIPVGFISFVFFGSSRRLKKNLNNPVKLKMPAIFLFVVSTVCLLLVVPGIFISGIGFFTEAGPFGLVSMIGLIFIPITLIDSFLVLRGVRKITRP